MVFENSPSVLKQRADIGHTNPSFKDDDAHDNISGVKQNSDKIKEGDSSREDKDKQQSKADYQTWKDLSRRQKAIKITIVTTKLIFLLLFLYLFICSLDFLSSAFRLLAGRVAGSVFRENELLTNPVCGVMIGVLATVLVQSSSTTTSIVVSMVSAGNLLDVKTAIPILMGANIGTSVTNTIVAMGQITNKKEFRRAFSGATVHDMFNWLTVIVFLPIESITNYLYYLSQAIVDSMHLEKYDQGDQDLLKAITKPFTSKIVQVDKDAIADIAHGKHVQSLLKNCCKTKVIYYNETVKQEENYPGSLTVKQQEKYPKSLTVLKNYTETVCKDPCDRYLFMDTGLSDEAVGAILLVLSLVILCLCLFAIVKVLNSLLKGKIRKVIKKFVNASLPGKFAYFTGYLAIIVGCGLTIIVQSSSIFTSTMTPLVGVGVIKLERMYPLTLGSNIGTTTTAILAALAGDSIKNSIQTAFCHLFFNISGILLFYPVPYLRFPIPLAKFLGRQTAKYRWFAAAYLVLMFFVFPLIIFGLSLAGWYVLTAVMLPIVIVIITIIIIRILQKKRPSVLPIILRDWTFLPVWCRSLRPLDNLFRKICPSCKCCNGKLLSDREENKTVDLSIIMKSDYSSSKYSIATSYSGQFAYARPLSEMTGSITLSAETVYSLETRGHVSLSPSVESQV